MRKLYLLGLFFFASVGAEAGLPQKINTFPVSDVRLTLGMFKHAEDLDICYLIGLNPDRLLAPYMKEAGLKPKAENYPNWENTGLDGHIGGHYLSALSYMYASTGNEEIGKRLDYFLSELKRCQDASGNGYLCGVPDGKTIWNEIKEGKINANPFGLNDRWVPLYNIHKTYAGLRDAYLVAGKEEAKGMLVALTDWMMDIVSGLTDEQIQDMLRSEHGGLNEVFADVYAITGDEKYLELAKRFSHRFILDPLVEKKDMLTGNHANTQIPKVIGFKRIADLDGNQEWSSASEFFWNTVVENRSVSIGGNSVREHFHKSDDFSSMMTSEQGPETCNTYNMLRLTKLLYGTSGDVNYMDYYERALYNHILSSQNPVQGGFVYFTPMRSGHYRVYSQPQNCFWCCVGSGMENHARYGEMIYASRDNELIVNLFISSVLNWEETGMSFTQETSFPEKEQTRVIVKSEKPRKMKISFRCPEWLDKEKAEFKVNGEKVETVFDYGYYTINRKWKDGDAVEMSLPMTLRAVQLPDKSPYYSFMYGPVVLAADLGKERLDGQFADDSRGGHVASGPQLPLQNMPVIVGEEKDLLANLKRVSPDKLEFRLSGVYPSRYDGMILKPFYKTHECRYMIYWELVSGDELKHRQAELAKQEAERVRLENITADMVACGEQQPESDHFIEMENSVIGSEQGTPWRETKGWFSYKMKSNGKPVNAVMINSFPDEARSAEIHVNGVKIGEINGRDSIHVLKLSKELLKNSEWDVKIMCGKSDVTPKFRSVRLIFE
ncbi:glycoside hydrolase family 127 protein [Bacteroides sp. ET336]|uniref:glycoside hydrolase family 127 protein n=1 Tax=Bacteroides sp. ET336 TaxID=2972459 RepID=UPI0021AC2852|nr:glycoside hydrolase family 127 protein [Bacteroides sp. ET336]MCR8894833.1 glycoside hydrolase family 127 protein [Bacteroides sp. ET336]MDN0059329.1 glycoside hydrolase family 127 protein [Bacteroides caecigallinarum]